MCGCWWLLLGSLWLLVCGAVWETQKGLGWMGVLGGVTSRVGGTCRLLLFLARSHPARQGSSRGQVCVCVCAAACLRADSVSLTDCGLPLLLCAGVDPD